MNCTRCGKYYDPRHNVGTWECRAHPGTFDAGTTQWSCCGFNPEIAQFAPYCMQWGCIAIDHDVQPTLTLPGERAFARAYKHEAKLIRGQAIARTIPFSTDGSGRADFKAALLAVNAGVNADGTAATIQRQAFLDPQFYAHIASVPGGPALIDTAVKMVERVDTELDVAGTGYRKLAALGLGSPAIVGHVAWLRHVLEFTTAMPWDGYLAPQRARLAKTFADYMQGPGGVKAFPAMYLVRRHEARPDPVVVDNMDVGHSFYQSIVEHERSLVSG